MAFYFEGYLKTKRKKEREKEGKKKRLWLCFDFGLSDR